MRWIGLFGLALIGFFGCSLDDALENAPCNTKDDCLGDYECVRTQHQASVPGSVGACRLDEQCALGYQEGCLASDDACFNGLSAVMASDGNKYCCSSGSTVVSANGVDSICAAMTGEEDLCDSTESCNAGNECVRTLEQEAEMLDVNDPELEAGFCRPQGEGCLQGGQDGCSADGTSCNGGLEFHCIDMNCYCCARPTNDMDFNVHVYAEQSDRSSGACIECRQSECDSMEMDMVTCTVMENGSACTPIGSGPCGCMPS